MFVLFFSPSVPEEMVELFPSLYRPAPATSHPPHTTAHAVETISRVQTTLPAVMQSLEPRFGGAVRGHTRLTAPIPPHQATRGTIMVPNSGPALVAATARQAMSVQTTRSSALPLVRSSPYPSFNQRQTYFGCHTGRSSRAVRPSGGDYTITILRS